MARVDKNRKLNIVLAYIVSIVAVTVISTLVRWYGPAWLWGLDLYLLAAIVHSLRNRPMGSLFYGLVLGFTQDVYSGSVIGLNALSKMVLSYVSASIKDVFLIRGLLQSSLVVALSVVADHLLRTAVQGMFNLPTHLNWQNLLLAVFLNLVVGIFMLIYKMTVGKRNQNVESYEKP